VARGVKEKVVRIPTWPLGLKNVGLVIGAVALLTSVIIQLSPV
jgi:hypothetical protein